MKDAFVCYGNNVKEIYDELYEESLMFNGNIHKTKLGDRVKLSKETMETIKDLRDVNKLVDKNMSLFYPNYSEMTYLDLGKSTVVDSETGEYLNEYVFFAWYPGFR